MRDWFTGIDHHFYTRVDDLRLARGLQGRTHGRTPEGLDLDPRDVMVIGDSVDDGIPPHQVRGRSSTTRDEPRRARIARFPVIDSLPVTDGSDLTAIGIRGALP